MSERYGRVMLDIDGQCLTDQDKFVISHKHVGGLILFSKNFQSFDQIKQLIRDIKDLKENIIIAVDHEGGRVQRFQKDFTKIPPMQHVAKFTKNNPDIFKEVGWLISKELISAGIDVNFAPVLDIDKNTSSIISDRAFSNDVKNVIDYAGNFIDGMHEAGMKSVGKHFPGHGNVVEDSHLELPFDNRSLAELFDKDIKPYINLKSKLDAIMCAHILYTQIDSEIPNFSKKWIHDILKNNIGFNGLIFSDDLSMKGAGKTSMLKKSVNSINAGCDMVLICNARNEAMDVLEKLDDYDIKPTTKISILKNNNVVDWDDLKKNQRAKKIRDTINEMGV